jgi:hypothetical protein
MVMVLLSNPFTLGSTAGKGILLEISAQPPLK